MISSLRRFLSVSFFAVMAFPGLAAAQNEGAEKTATHGDWEIHCQKGTDNCVMLQLANNTEGKRSLLIQIQRVAGIPPQDGVKIAGSITVTVPLGVFLNTGLGAKIDSKQLGGLPFNYCVDTGCVAEAPLTEETVGRMKKGSTAVFSFNLITRGRIDVPVSLRGYTKAFNSLKEVTIRKR